MKLSLVSGSVLLIGLTTQSVFAKPNLWNHAKRKLGPIGGGRKKSIFVNPLGHPELPSLTQAKAAAASVGMNLTNIQGDILIGMKKNKELFFFFQINDPVAFKLALLTDISALVTSTTQLLSVNTQPTTAVNIAFSQKGLAALGVTDGLGDFFFNNGQISDASSLGDGGTQNWASGFTKGAIHGVFLLASDTMDNVNAELAHLQSVLGSAVTEVHRVQGQARPGDQQGHEHFGYMDGISQPAVKGFTTNPLPGQAVVNPGLFILGQDGDSNSRPAWANDGSFLVFRQLQQKVPEFNSFLKQNALNVPGLSAQENVDLLGARMVGRWKSGAPVDLAPLKDDPALGADAQRNNNFNFKHAGKNFASDQSECPFTAHIRKSRPRADFQPENDLNHILRAGIPYGPEVTSSEAASGKSDPAQERGLAFVSYQSDIGNGFRFIQQQWMNSQFFSPGHNISTPGFDPISGANGGNARFSTGLDPRDATKRTNLPIDFVVSRGGEYFFTPPISALTGVLCSGVTPPPASSVPPSSVPPSSVPPSSVPPSSVPPSSAPPSSVPPSSVPPSSVPPSGPANPPPSSTPNAGNGGGYGYPPVSSSIVTPPGKPPVSSQAPISSGIVTPPGKPPVSGSGSTYVPSGSVKPSGPVSSVAPISSGIVTPPGKPPVSGSGTYVPSGTVKPSGPISSGIVTPPGPKPPVSSVAPISSGIVTPPGPKPPVSGSSYVPSGTVKPSGPVSSGIVTPPGPKPPVSSVAPISSGIVTPPGPKPPVSSAAPYPGESLSVIPPAQPLSSSFPISSVSPAQPSVVPPPSGPSGVIIPPSQPSVVPPPSGGNGGYPSGGSGSDEGSGSNSGFPPSSGSGSGSGVGNNNGGGYDVNYPPTNPPAIPLPPKKGSGTCKAKKTGAKNLKKRGVAKVVKKVTAARPVVAGHNH